MTAQTTFQEGRTEIRYRGEVSLVPSLVVDGREIIVTGRFPRVAAIHDDAFVQGAIVPDPTAMIAALRSWRVRADIFTFTQHLDHPRPPHEGFHIEWHSYAVIPLTTYDDWLKTRVRRDVRENVRRATREGVTAMVVECDQAFVAGVKRLFDSTTVRQGMTFWHRGRSMEDLTRMLSTYRERACYVGAFYEGALIGFLKMVYTGRTAKTMHVFAAEEHFRKRPVNALVSKAVEAAIANGKERLIYGEYTYPGGLQTSLTEFKKHNGFEEVLYPRYYVPLTLRGHVALRAGLHRELHYLLPQPAVRRLKKWRQQLLGALATLRGR
jgi:hypothetical protein